MVRFQRLGHGYLWGDILFTMPSDLQDSQYDMVGAEMGDRGKGLESPEH